MLRREELDHIRRGSARNHLPFSHSADWRDSVVAGRRTSPYISTEGNPAIIKLHNDRGKTGVGGGGPMSFRADTLPRTLLSGVSGQESPTVTLARQEMSSWRLLQFELSALRTPDSFDDLPRMTTTGRHLPATLHRLAVKDPRTCSQIANRLAELIEDVNEIWIDKDDRRQTLTLMMAERGTGDLPAELLSDGTLRCIAMAALELDPEEIGLICLEEPENGIHPQGIQTITRLLQDGVMDVSLPVDEYNPMRQVIINTHSPVVVAQVPDDCLLFAEKQPQVVSRLPFASEQALSVPQHFAIKGLNFSCLPGTWRHEKAKVSTIPSSPSH